MDSDDEDGMASINGFCFCEKHGSELCHKCCCDYRIGNNFSIMKRLLNDLPDQSEDDFEVRISLAKDVATPHHNVPKVSYLFRQGRPPLSNAYGLGAVLSKTRHLESPESLLYECKEHAEVNCNTCFDWGKLVVARIKFVAKNQGDIEIEASRDEKLGLLSAMGVGFSPSTRLPEAAVDRKLRSALDAAQTFTNVVEQTPLDPSTLPIWSSNQPKKIFAAIQRSSYAESMKVLSAKANGQTPFPLYQNAFMDLRQTLMTLANYCDTGRRTAILQDKNHEFAICVRVSISLSLRFQYSHPVTLFDSSDRQRFRHQRRCSCHSPSLRARLPIYTSSGHHGLDWRPHAQRRPHVSDHRYSAGAGASLDSVSHEL